MSEPSPAGSGLTAGNPPFSCPFCGLACDDLSLPLNTLPCERARVGFEAALAAPLTAMPRVNGERVDWETALSAAANHLKRAELPLFHGLIGDLTDSRAAMTMAAHFGGSIDHAHGEALARSLRVYQDNGWQITSLGEARNRADLIILVGADAAEAMPRFHDRVLTKAEGLHRDQPATLISIPEEPLSMLREARARLDGRAVDLSATDTESLAKALTEARYAVFVANDDGSPDYELVLRSLVGLVRKLNETGRAALLPLNAGDGAATAQSCAAWHTGFGIRTSLASGMPEQDLDRYAAERLLMEDEADCLLWLNSLTDREPPETDLPTILFAHPGLSATAMEAADVFLPVAVPGVDRVGFIHRADGLRLVPLKALRDSELPDSLSLARQLIEAAGAH